MESHVWLAHAVCINTQSALVHSLTNKQIYDPYKQLHVYCQFEVKNEFSLLKWQFLAEYKPVTLAVMLTSGVQIDKAYRLWQDMIYYQFINVFHHSYSTGFSWLCLFGVQLIEFYSLKWLVCLMCSIELVTMLIVLSIILV